MLPHASDIQLIFLLLDHIILSMILFAQTVSCYDQHTIYVTGFMEIVPNRTLEVTR